MSNEFKWPESQSIEASSDKAIVGLSISAPVPPKNIVFMFRGSDGGVLEFSKEENRLKFTGDVGRSARLFIQTVNSMLNILPQEPVPLRTKADGTFLVMDLQLDGGTLTVPVQALEKHNGFVHILGEDIGIGEHADDEYSFKFRYMTEAEFLALGEFDSW